MSHFLKIFLAFFLVLQILFPAWGKVFAIHMLGDEKRLPYVEGEVLVKFKDSYINTQNKSEMKLLSAQLESAGKQVHQVLTSENLVLIKNNNSNILDFVTGVEIKDSVPDLIRLYEKNPNVEYVQPNFLYKESSDIQFNDPLYNNQWYLHNIGQSIQANDGERMNATNNIDINYPEARKIYNTAYNRLSQSQKSPILIGVIDSGIDYNHEEFSGRLWDGSNCKDPNGNNVVGGCKYGYDTGDDDNDPFRNNEHGTQVSGVIIAQENNNKGIVGIHPHAKLVSVKVKTSNNTYDSAKIIQSINFMKHNNVSIVNMSLSASPSSAEYADIAVYNAMKDFPGIIINSAGNQNTDIDNHTTGFVIPGSYRGGFIKDGAYYPALTNLIVVGAEEPDGTKRFKSNYGKKSTNIFAPGGWLQTTSTFNQKYWTTGGTSFSAPIVTASLAFAKQAYPNKSWSELKQIMHETATPVNAYKDISISGGRLNLGAMMEKLENEYQQNTPLNATISANNTHWTNQGVILTLRTNKEVNTPEGWTRVSGREFTKNISENGNIRVTARNSLNQEATAQYNVTNIDKNPPNISITQPQNNSTIQETINVIFSGSDLESGIARYECKQDNGTWNTCTSPKTINANSNSEIIVSVRAIDKAGNISNSRSIQLRNIPLNATISANNTHWTNQNITLTLRTNKNIHTPEGWTRVSGTEFTKIVSENGNIRVTLRNNFNQETTVQYNVTNIDKNPPNITITHPNNQSNIHETVNVVFSGSDAESSIARYECKQDNAGWHTCTSPKTINANNNPKITLSIRAIDHAGNISSPSNIQLQNTPPHRHHN